MSPKYLELLFNLLLRKRELEVIIEMRYELGYSFLDWHFVNKRILNEGQNLKVAATVEVFMFLARVSDDSGAVMHWSTTSLRLHCVAQWEVKSRPCL